MAPFNRSRRSRSQAKKSGNFAFIDSQNLNLGVQKVGWKMDWRKFRVYLREKHNVTSAYMFIGYMPENESLYEQMHDAGYLVVLKPTLDMFEKTEGPGPRAQGPEAQKEEKPATKGNVDAELVLYAVKEMPNYHKAVIVSGDGDFYGLVEYLIKQNKLERLLAPNWQYSTLLKPFESYIERIDQKRRELAYRGFKKKK